MSRFLWFGFWLDLFGFVYFGFGVCCFGVLVAVLVVCVVSGFGMLAVCWLFVSFCGVVVVGFW